MKLDRALAELRGGRAPGAAVAGAGGARGEVERGVETERGGGTPPTSAPLQVAPAKKGVPLKNLGGLDSLFRR